MHFSHVLFLALSTLPPIQAQTKNETVVGVYIFSRHGDRTAKSTPPTNLTTLGYQEVVTSGTYFRNRYISSDASLKIAGLNPDLVKLSQITASAPLDNVLMSSTQGFLQGLYPPVGPQLGSNTLRNGTVIDAQMNGYQIIPIQTVTGGTGSEDEGWLQGSSNCAKALVSSNAYFTSPEYEFLLNNTSDFYKSLSPMINATFTSAQTSFMNAYTIFDLLNVASIHNTTFPSSDLLTDSTLAQTRTLADTHEWNLAYNASDPIRAITGSTLAAQILQALNTTISGKGGSKLNVQFGAYAGFQSFFGLAGLNNVDPAFYGVPDYASTMTFELFTNSTAPVNSSSFPPSTDLNVRFLWHNGTTSNISEPVPYPLFGLGAESLPWSTFATEMGKFAVGSQADWCSACGNSTGSCAISTGSNNSSSSSGNTSSSSGGGGGGGGGGGVSRPVAGVIGAMVTLAVILGIEGLVLLVGGMRVVSQKRLGGGGATNGAVQGEK
ncbi:hypothetical protein MMC09_001783 [Bachmanniomyces sp. S44760]|nr:hypothetical protein [Bachmanniomyces sp. S44760]